MPEVVPRSHWMIEVTRRSGLLRPERSTMALGPTLTDVWQAVARACDVTESDLALQIARHYRMATADLATASSSAQSLIPEKLARRFAAFPVRADDRHITVAVSDPTNIDGTGVRVRLRTSAGVRHRAARGDPAPSMGGTHRIDWSSGWCRASGRR